MGLRQLFDLSQKKNATNCLEKKKRQTQKAAFSKKNKKNTTNPKNPPKVRKKAMYVVRFRFYC